MTLNNTGKRCIQCFKVTVRKADVYAPVKTLAYFMESKNFALKFKFVVVCHMRSF